MKRLSLLALTVLLSLGCQRSDADPLSPAQPTSSSNQNPNSKNTRLTACTDADEWTCEVEAAIVRLTNGKRASQRLQPLQQEFEASSIAREHSFEMVTAGINHNGFDARFLKLAATLSIDISYKGENVAMFSSRGDDVNAIAAELVRMWWESPGHRKNMLGSFSYIGVGVFRNSSGSIFATQMFH